VTIVSFPRISLNPSHVRRILVAALATAAGLVGAGQARATDPFTLSGTEVRPLPVSSNGRSYVLYVALPPSYATSPSRTYPVVYGTDGYYDFALLAMNLGNAEVDGLVPECILVTIAYGGVNPDVATLRARDLTPGIDPSYDPLGLTTGRAQDFLGVITGQIIPFVETTYRVDPTFRALTGNSFGGLFGLFVMFQQPGLFQAIVASSPAIWWRNEYILSLAENYGASGAALNCRLWMNYGTEDGASIVTPTRDLVQELPKLGIPGLAVASREIEGERHSSTKPEGYNRGLRFAFANLAPLPSSALRPGFSSRSTMVNLSTRGLVGGGQGALIAGLVVSGLHPKLLLVRAAGPALAGFGITNPLADPRFSIVDSSQKLVAANDNWGSAPDPTAISAAAAQVGAFYFAPDSRDAAVLVTLDPGAYTVVVDSPDGTTGVALVEAYEVLP
jgi:predicted alpha/beta superfamily hydrolase